MSSDQTEAALLTVSVIDWAIAIVTFESLAESLDTASLLKDVYSFSLSDIRQSLLLHNIQSIVKDVLFPDGS